MIEPTQSAPPSPRFGISDAIARDCAAVLLEREMHSASLVVESLLADRLFLREQVNSRLPAFQIKGHEDAPSAARAWLAIFTAVASCHNSNSDTATRWADNGLALYRARFPKAVP